MKRLITTGVDCLSIVSEFLPIDDVMKIFLWIDAVRSSPLTNMKNQVMKRVLWNECLLVRILKIFQEVVQAETVLTNKEQQIINVRSILHDCSASDSEDEIVKILKTRTNQPLLKLKNWNDVHVVVKCARRLSYILLAKQYEGPEVTINISMLDCQVFGSNNALIEFASMVAKDMKDTKKDKTKRYLYNANVLLSSDQCKVKLVNCEEYKPEHLKRNIVFHADNNQLTNFCYCKNPSHLNTSNYTANLIARQESPRGGTLSMNDIENLPNFITYSKWYSPLYCAFNYISDGLIPFPIHLAIHHQSKVIKTTRESMRQASRFGLTGGLFALMLVFGFGFTFQHLIPPHYYENHRWVYPAMILLDFGCIFSMLDLANHKFKWIDFESSSPLFSKYQYPIAVSCQVLKYAMFRHFEWFSFGTMFRMLLNSGCILVTALLTDLALVLGAVSGFWAMRSSQWFYKRIARVGKKSWFFERWVKAAFNWVLKLGQFHPVDVDTSGEVCFN